MAEQVVRFKAKDGTVHETPELADEHDRFENFRKAASEIFCLPQSKAWQEREMRTSGLAPGGQLAQSQQRSAYSDMASNISLRQIWWHREKLLPLLAQEDEFIAIKREVVE